MPDGHIHDELSAPERAARDAAIVADYENGMRIRGVMQKYQVGRSTVSAALAMAGISARRGGSRIWINKRVRNTNASELVCSKCSATKPVIQFPPQGLVCCECVNARLAIWRDKNRDEINFYTKEWMRAKKKADPQYRAICAMKCRLVRVLGASGKKKSKKSITEFLGISRNGFVAHIESLMLPGMTWENRRYGVWHIDHIIPCTAFDHESERQVRDCWHYTNLRPLWGPENLRKYNKITPDAMIGPKLIAA